MGAIVWAGGSHECSGQTGTLTPRPTSRNSATAVWVPVSRSGATRAISSMSVVPVRTASSTRPMSMTAEPAAVYSTNLVAADDRAAAPSRSPGRAEASPNLATTNHIGTRTVSNATKNSRRSRATKVATAPEPTSSSAASSAGGATSAWAPSATGSWPSEVHRRYRTHSSTSTAVRTTSGAVMPSQPSRSRLPSRSAHGRSTATESPAWRHGGATSSRPTATSAPSTADASATVDGTPAEPAREQGGRGAHQRHRRRRHQQQLAAAHRPPPTRTATTPTATATPATQER